MAYNITYIEIIAKRYTLALSHKLFRVTTIKRIYILSYLFLSLYHIPINCMLVAVIGSHSYTCVYMFAHLTFTLNNMFAFAVGTGRLLYFGVLYCYNRDKIIHLNLCEWSYLSVI